MPSRPRAGCTPEPDALAAPIDEGVRIAPLPSPGGCNPVPPPCRSFGLTRAIADLLRMPMLVVEVRGVLHFCNDAGERLLADGRFASLPGNRLALAFPTDDRRLWALVREAHATSDCVGRSARLPTTARTSVLRIRDATATQWATVYVRSLQEDLDPQPREAGILASLLFDVSSASRTPDASILEKSFELTRTESRVASLLVTGTSPVRIARALDVSVATVRTHMKAIFRKTGSRRQSEVVARLSMLSWLAP